MVLTSEPSLGLQRPCGVGPKGSAPVPTGPALEASSTRSGHGEASSLLGLALATSRLAPSPRPQRPQKRRAGADQETELIPPAIARHVVDGKSVPDPEDMHHEKRPCG